MGECLFHHPVIVIILMYDFHIIHIFKVKFYLALEVERFFFFVKILKSLVFGLGCISRVTVLFRLCPSPWPKCSASFIMDYAYSLLYGQLGKRPCCHVPHVKPESTLVIYLDSFFGQTQHLNSFRIDALEKNALIKTHSFKMRSF